MFERGGYFFNTEGLFWNLHAILFWEIIFCFLTCAFYSSRFIPNQFLLIYQSFELVDYVAGLVKIYISSFKGLFIPALFTFIYLIFFFSLKKNIFFAEYFLNIKIWKRIRNYVSNLITWQKKSKFFLTPRKRSYTITDKFSSRNFFSQKKFNNSSLKF